MPCCSINTIPFLPSFLPAFLRLPRHPVHLNGLNEGFNSLKVPLLEHAFFFTTTRYSTSSSSISGLVLFFNQWEFSLPPYHISRSTSDYFGELRLRLTAAGKKPGWSTSSILPESLLLQIAAMLLILSIISRVHTRVE